MAMICPDCGNMIGYNSYFSAFYCPRCGGIFKKVKPMTNADRIRSMNDKELKKFICSMFKCEFCDFELGERCGLLNWLQMPAEVNE